jgi:hypothetical protein
LIFKIPVGSQKNFLEIYREFRQAPSEKFARPGLGFGLDGLGFDLRKRQ